MVNSRNKGAAAEREVAKIIFEELGIQLYRDLEQYRSADHGDLITEDPSWPFCIEVKRYGVGAGMKNQWWSQVKNASQATGREPVLFYKYNNKPWRVVIELGLIQDGADESNLIEMSPTTFCFLAREEINK